MKINRLTTNSIIVIIFASFTTFSNMSFAQSLQTDSPIPYKSLTSQEEATIGRTTIVVWRHISQARLNLHRKALPSARRNLAEAERLVETIKEVLSTAPAKNLIQIARMHLEYETAHQVLRDLPQIYSSLEMVSTYLPVDRAMLHIGRAKKALERNDKREANSELGLADTSLMVIEVELPLLRSQQYIQKAQGYLAAGNAGKADEALQTAERRMTTLYTGLNSPLFQARGNAWLAFRNYCAAGKGDAGRYLGQVRANLEKSAVGKSTTGKEKALNLSREIAELENKLAGEGTVAESALKAVWEKSVALAERSAAYLSADLSEEETTLRGDYNLIEARMHVAYAETYQVTTTEPDKTIKELDTAYSYLQKALTNPLAGPSDRKKIRGVEKILLSLKASPEKKDFVVQENYDKAREELSGLIQKM